MRTQIDFDTKSFRVEYTCDLCGEPIRSANGHVEETAELKITTHRKASIKRETAERWGDAGSSEYDELDCCPKCFDEKIRPLIENTFRVKFRHSTSEW